MVNVSPRFLPSSRCLVAGGAVCAPAGEIDADTAPLLRRALRALEDQPWPRRVVVDLVEVRSLGEAGVRVLTTSANRALGYRIELVAATYPVRRALTVCGVSDRFRIYPSLTKALQVCTLAAHPTAEQAG